MPDPPSRKSTVIPGSSIKYTSLGPSPGFPWNPQTTYLLGIISCLSAPWAGWHSHLNAPNWAWWQQQGRIAWWCLHLGLFDIGWNCGRESACAVSFWLFGIGLWAIYNRPATITTLHSHITTGLLFGGICRMLQISSAFYCLAGGSSLKRKEAQHPRLFSIQHLISFTFWAYIFFFCVILGGTRAWALLCG